MGPFYRCSRCERMQLGTLFIRRNVHSRRCRNCAHKESERLPPLEKKLVYLDQMVLSGIAKEIDPVWRGEISRRDDSWLQVFDQIDRLVKLQLIVCPDSPIHEEESSYDNRYETVLRRLYEHLASGISLHFPHQVHVVQLWEAFEAWSENRDPDWDRITRDDVVDGRLDHWSDRLLLTVNMGHWPGRIESRRNTRTRGHEVLMRLWKQWESESRMSFEERFEIERRGVVEAAPWWLGQFTARLLQRLEMMGVPCEEQSPRVARFLRSEPALSAPQNHLGALLYASLARRAASGQKRCPDRGTPNDIAFIASYLPYCDAMFIDNECAQLLSEEPLASAVKDYPVRVFSTRSREGLSRLLGCARIRSRSGPYCPCGPHVRNKLARTVPSHTRTRAKQADCVALIQCRCHASVATMRRSYQGGRP